MNPMQQVPLPSPDAIRARIDALDEESALLRKLLRVVLRIETRKPKTTPDQAASASEVAHVA